MAKIHVAVDLNEVAEELNERVPGSANVESDYIDCSLEVAVEAVLAAIQYDIVADQHEIASVTYIGSR